VGSQIKYSSLSGGILFLIKGIEQGMEKPRGFSFLRRGLGAPEGAPKRSEATSEISRMGHK